MLLELQGVSRRYWHEEAVLVNALEDVSLQLGGGELVVVWGRRASGKSTLARVAAGIEPPDAGSVCLNGRVLDARRFSTPVLAPGVALVQLPVERPQPGMSLLDYVARPMLGERSLRQARRRARTLLERVGLARTVHRSCASLSGGERVFVALARALARQPILIVADDATVGLDALERERLMGLLRDATRLEGTGVLAMAPDLPEAALADRCGSLHNGRLTMAGEASRGGDVVPFPDVRRAG